MNSSVAQNTFQQILRNAKETHNHALVNCSCFWQQKQTIPRTRAGRRRKQMNTPIISPQNIIIAALRVKHQQRFEYLLFRIIIIISISSSHTSHGTCLLWRFNEHTAQTQTGISNRHLGATLPQNGIIPFYHTNNNCCFLLLQAMVEQKNNQNNKAQWAGTIGIGQWYCIINSNHFNNRSVFLPIPIITDIPG